MNRNIFLRPVITAIAPTLFLGGIASAEMLSPGSITDSFSTDLAARPDLGGPVEAAAEIPFSLTDDQGKVFYLGQVQHDVMRDPKTSELSFSYRFINAPSSAVLGVEDLVANDFKSYATDVAILTDKPGDSSPVDALRSSDGAQVVFDFDAVSSRIEPNHSSFTFLVKTNATAFDDKGSANIHAFTAESAEEGSNLLAGGNATISTFRPTGAPAVVSPPPPAAVPLPPAALAAIPSLLGCVIYIQRSRRKSHTA